MTQPVGLCEHALHFTRSHRLWIQPHPALTSSINCRLDACSNPAMFRVDHCNALPVLPNEIDDATLFTVLTSDVLAPTFAIFINVHV